MSDSETVNLNPNIVDIDDIRSGFSEKERSTWGVKLQEGINQRKIHISKLFVDTENQYQAVLDRRRVANIIKLFRRPAVNWVLVSERDDGRFAIMNGQHTYTALRVMGAAYVDCIVVTGLSHKEEAELFVACNDKRTHTPPGAARSIYADAARGVVSAKKILAILKRLDIIISSEDKPNAFSRVAVLTRLFKLDGTGDAIEQGFLVLREAWPQHKIPGIFLHATSGIWHGACLAYDTPDLHEHLVNVVRRYNTPLAWTQKVQQTLNSATVPNSRYLPHYLALEMIMKGNAMARRSGCKLDQTIALDKSIFIQVPPPREERADRQEAA